MQKCAQFRYISNNEYQNKNFDKYFDLSNLATKKINDDTLQISGHVKVIKDFIDVPYQMKIKAEKWNGKSWSTTPIQMYKPSMCAHFQDKKTYSYNLTKLWKKCPPKKGVSLY